MGTDLERLESGLALLGSLVEELYSANGRQRPQLLGSVFVPSKKLLAQMRFRCVTLEGDGFVCSVLLGHSVKSKTIPALGCYPCLKTTAAENLALISCVLAALVSDFKARHATAAKHLQYL